MPVKEEKEVKKEKEEKPLKGLPIKKSISRKFKEKIPESESDDEVEEIIKKSDDDEDEKDRVK